MRTATSPQSLGKPCDAFEVTRVMHQSMARCEFGEKIILWLFIFSDFQVGDRSSVWILIKYDVSSSAVEGCQRISIQYMNACWNPNDSNMTPVFDWGKRPLVEG